MMKSMEYPPEILQIIAAAREAKKDEFPVGNYRYQITVIDPIVDSTPARMPSTLDEPNELVNPWIQWVE